MREQGQVKNKITVPKEYGMAAISFFTSKGYDSLAIEFHDGKKTWKKAKTEDDFVIGYVFKREYLRFELHGAANDIHSMELRDFIYPEKTNQGVVTLSKVAGERVAKYA